VTGETKCVAPGRLACTHPGFPGGATGLQDNQGTGSFRGSGDEFDFLKAGIVFSNFVDHCVVAALCEDGGFQNRAAPWGAGGALSQTLPARRKHHRKKKNQKEISAAVLNGIDYKTVCLEARAGPFNIA